LHTALLRKGTEEVVNFVKKVFAAVKAWLEELAGVRKKVDDIADLAAEELDWMASREIGALGGKVLKQTQIRQLRRLLAKKNIQLIVDGDIKSSTRLFTPTGGFKTAEDLFFFMKTKKPPYVGMFNAETKQFFLSKKATEIVAFHEMAHVKHFEEVGEAAYKTYSKLEKEMYVWKQIFSQRYKWTRQELQDALNYINRIRTEPEFGYNLEPLNIKL
jgi:Metallopeptidase toxin 4